MNNQIKKKAFTMIELMIVVAIISVLSIVLIPKAKSQYEQSKMIGVVKNKDLLETIVRGEYEKPTYEVETEDSSIDRVYKNLENNQDLEEMTNPFSKSGKGIGFIKGNTIEDTHKAGYVLTEEPDLEELPKGTVYIIIKDNEVTSGMIENTATKPTTELVLNVNSFSNINVLSKNNNTYVFGENNYGQLGLGDNTNRLTPTLLTLTSIVKPKSISIGLYHSLAIGSDGNLYSWGHNRFGQLGDGTTTNKSKPTLINIPNGVKPKSVLAGIYNSLAIGTDGNLYSWGLNSSGQLGTGDTVDRKTPTLITLPNNVKPKSIESGEHSIVIGDDENLYAWGMNDYGQLATGDTIDRLTPILITLPNGVKPRSVSLGYHHSLAIGDDGNLYAWGYNAYGQLGSGGTTASSRPILVKLANEVKPISIATGHDHSLAIGTDGNLYTWGFNNYGQLGAGNRVNKLRSSLINLPNGVKPKTIATGNNFSIAIGTDGNLYTWGYNDNGQLGTGNMFNEATPQLVNPFELIE